MTDFFHTLKDKATGKSYSVLDVNAAKKDLSNIGTVNVSTFTNDAGYLTAIPNTYKTKTENDALYQAKGTYLTAIPNTVAFKTDISSFKAPSDINLADLKNVSGTPNTNDYLQWTGSTWEGKPLSVSFSPTITSPKEGERLIYRNNAWVNGLPEDHEYKNTSFDAKPSKFYFIGIQSSSQQTVQLPDDSDLEVNDKIFILASIHDGASSFKYFKIKVGAGARTSSNIYFSGGGGGYTDEYTMTEDDMGAVYMFTYARDSGKGFWTARKVFDWTTLPRDLNSLKYVSTRNPSNGQALVWNGYVWQNKDVGSNIVTYNAEWTPDASKPIPDVIKDLKKGAWIRFNGNIMELKDDGDKLTKSPDLDFSNYKMVIPNRSLWDSSYKFYVEGELVYHKDAWWRCKQDVNVGDEPGTSLGAFKWEKWEGKVDHEDYLRLDSGKLYSNSGHAIAEHGKNIVSYDSGKLYQGDGNTALDFTTKAEQKAITDLLATKTEVNAKTKTTYNSTKKSLKFG